MERALSRHCRGSADGWLFLVFVLLVLLVNLFIMHMPPHPPSDLEQRAQFNSLGASLELFLNEFDAYPSSEPNDPAGSPYCGAMKLAEALMGQDLLGFHANSTFHRDGLDATGARLYSLDLDALSPALRDVNLKARKGPYIQVENANAFRLVDIYGKGNTGPFPENTLVLCDTYEQKRPSGKRTGMPILYYRANPSRTLHDVNNPDNPQNIYSYKDNQVLVGLGVPNNPNAVHPLADPERFYLNTRDDRTTGASRPYRKDSYILISAGWDGLYGTADDVCNFRWKYRER